MSTTTEVRLRVRKRDGTIRSWDERRVVRAMMGAFNEVDPTKVPDVTPIVKLVMKNLEPGTGGIVEIEDIQDRVEHAVLYFGYPDVAGAFMRFREKRAKRRKAMQKPDGNAIADYIHLAKYGKWREDLGRRETYLETVKRVETMHLERYAKDDELLNTMIRRAFDYVRDKKVLPSMRSMQFAGAAVNQHHARMYNCSFTHVDRPEVFAEAFYLLLAGSGVGFSVQWQHVDLIPAMGRVSKGDVTHHVVGDSIGGWADALKNLMVATIEGRYIEFSYSGIRPEGAILKTSGGRAPGHLPLKLCLERIRELLYSAQGRKLRPIECHDIMCHMAEAVLAGGIRRSSLISLFSADDTEMLYAKTAGTFNPSKGINGQRAMANNSAVLDRNESSLTLRPKFARIIRLAQEGWGEPGFFFTNDLDYGTNPCGEIGLHPKTADGRSGFAFCNLCEVNMARIEDKQDFIDAAKAASLIGTLQAGYTDFRYLSKASEEIANTDALLGIGLTGMADNPELAFDGIAQCDAMIGAVNTNSVVAEMIGIMYAQRVGCVKPSGTASLELGGVASGIHKHHAKRYLRRVTANPLEPIAQLFREVNPHMVEIKPNGDWALVFPTQAPDGSDTIKDSSALDFLEGVLGTYDNWITAGTVGNRSPGLTHNVSATVTVRDEELQGVIDRVWESRDRIAAMSFAPITLDKKFPFAPREAIETEADEERWTTLIRHYRPVDYSSMKEDAGSVSRPGLEPACIGGICEI